MKWPDNKFMIETWLSYGWIKDGKSQDSDYLFNDRQGEWSRSISETDENNVFDYSVAIGFRLDKIDRMKKDDQLIFLMGYSCHSMKLETSKGYSVIPIRAPFSYQGTSSTYDAKWKGPWIGFEMDENLNGKLNYLFRFEYHLADYYGEANWILRDDLSHPKSFEHIADGNGYVFCLGFGYKMYENITLELLTNYQR